MQTRQRQHLGRKAAAVTMLAALGISACSSNDEANSFATPGTDAPAEAAPELEDEGSGDVAAEPDAVAPVTGGTAPTGLPFDETFGRDLIIEMGLTMSTPNVQRTLDDVRRLTQANGGAVFRADVNVGEELEDGSVTGGGTLEIRIPPELLAALVDDLSGVARVSNVRQDTQDVTDQLIDLEIRIRQARTGIAQIEVLYGQATEFEDLVEIERELARRQVELERLLAAERGVEGRVALSTLTITIAFEPVPADDEVVAEEETGDDGIADAFRNGWDAFAGAMFAVAFVLAVSAPFLAIAALVLLVGWLVTRRRNGTRAPVARTRATGSDELVGASHED